MHARSSAAFWRFIACPKSCCQGHRSQQANGTAEHAEHTAQPLAVTKRAQLQSVPNPCSAPQSLQIRPPASVGRTAKQKFQRRCKQMHAKHADSDRSEE